MSLFGHEAALKVGTIVNYVMRAEDYMPGATRKGYEDRPAIVVDVPSKTAPHNPDAPYPVGLQVFLAGAEDGTPVPPAPQSPQTPVAFGPPVAIWRTGVIFSAAHTPGTWHWPE